MAVEVVVQFKTPQDVLQYILRQLRDSNFLVYLDEYYWRQNTVYAEVDGRYLRVYTRDGLVLEYGDKSGWRGPSIRVYSLSECSCDCTCGE